MLWFSNFTKEEMVSHSLNGTCVPILVNCVYVWVSVHRERKSISIARIVKDMSTYISQRSLWYYISLLFLLALFLLCSSAWEYQFERPADSCIGTYSGMQQFLDWTVIMATTTPKCGHPPVAKPHPGKKWHWVSCFMCCSVEISTQKSSFQWVTHLQTVTFHGLCVCDSQPTWMYRNLGDCILEQALCARSYTTSLDL